MRAYVEKGKEEEYIYVSVCLRVAISRVIKHVLANLIHYVFVSFKNSIACAQSLWTPYYEKGKRAENEEKSALKETEKSLVLLCGEW